jgi:hypothetical protein
MTCVTYHSVPEELLQLWSAHWTAASIRLLDLCYYRVVVAPVAGEVEGRDLSQHALNTCCLEACGIKSSAHADAKSLFAGLLLSIQQRDLQDTTVGR